MFFNNLIKSSITLSELGEIYKKNKQNYIITAPRYELELRWFDEFLNYKKKLHQLEQLDIENYNNYLYSMNKKPVTILCKFKLILTALKYAQTINLLSGATILKVPKITIPKRPPLFLNKDEMKQILTNCKNPNLSDIVTTAFQTGMRQAELTNLQWNQINLEEKTLILDNETHTTKNKEMRIVPLTEEVIEILKRRAKSKDYGYVFTDNGRKWSRNVYVQFVKLARQTLGNDCKIKFHSLRHSFASNLVKQGVSLFIVKELLGHKNIQSTMIYAHLCTNDLQPVVEKLSLTS